MGFPAYGSKHLFLKLQAVSIHDPAILSKIHQTYRIGYIKDVILPKVLDEQTFVTINSIMLFNNVAVVSSLQNDSTFLSELFSKLRSPDTSDRCQRDLVGCNFLFDIAYSLCVHACFLDVCYRGPLIKQQHCCCPPTIQKTCRCGHKYLARVFFFQGLGGWVCCCPTGAIYSGVLQSE
jgi:hypothetical protein